MLLSSPQRAIELSLKFHMEIVMAKKRKKRGYKIWTADDLKALRQHSRAKTSVAKLSKVLKRTEATIRMKAYGLGLSVGHRRRKA